MDQGQGAAGCEQQRRLDRIDIPLDPSNPRRVWSLSPPPDPRACVRGRAECSECVRRARRGNKQQNKGNKVALSQLCVRACVRAYASSQRAQAAADDSGGDRARVGVGVGNEGMWIGYGRSYSLGGCGVHRRFLTTRRRTSCPQPRPAQPTARHPRRWKDPVHNPEGEWKMAVANFSLLHISYTSWHDLVRVWGGACVCGRVWACVCGRGFILNQSRKETVVLQGETVWAGGGGGRGVVHGCYGVGARLDGGARGWGLGVGFAWTSAEGQLSGDWATCDRVAGLGVLGDGTDGAPPVRAMLQRRQPPCSGSPPPL